jgi:hypothetical protein
MVVDPQAIIPVIAAIFLIALLGGGAVVATTKSPEFMGQPKGLYMLFFAEMWERFSYYGMRALLIFYLTQHWLFSDGKSNLIYGAYTSLVYITPLLGGYLADRYLGQRRAVLFGAVLLTCGHFHGVRGQRRSGGPDDQRFLASPQPHHRRLRVPQSQHLGDGRATLSVDRRPPRRRLHHLLHGD